MAWIRHARRGIEPYHYSAPCWGAGILARISSPPAGRMPAPRHRNLVKVRCSVMASRPLK